MTMITEGQIFNKNGFQRQVVMMTESCVLVKNVGMPVKTVQGRPPFQGVIWKSSFLKWLKNNDLSPEMKTKKIQLII